MIKKAGILFFSAIVIILFVVGCKKEDKNNSNSLDSSFDKKGMLANIGENIIIPAYNDFKASVDTLDFFTDIFLTEPSLTNLINAQTYFIHAYAYYQWISTFEFGPAEQELIRASFNIFPCNIERVNSKIAAGDYNLSTVADIDVKGLPAIDFLLFGSTQNNDSVLAKFTTDANASNAKNYLTALVDEIKTKIGVVSAAWGPSGGNYITTFKSNTGSNVGSSIGMLVNQLNYDYEILKNARIGIPLGKKSTGPLPDKVEALYSTKSLLLAMEQLNSIENIYLGRSRQNIDGLGFDDYLDHLDAQHPSGKLNDVIKNKFISAKTKLAAVPGILSQTVMLNPAVVDSAYVELQQMVVLLKVDMTSAMGVLITYQDNDGD